jgi:undecaprenyl-diphosphatase
VELFEAILLGIVQGLTEFLPVSSSGHLVMVQALMGKEIGGGIVFEVAVHLATLVAIVVFYFKRIWSIAVGVLKGYSADLTYVGKLMVGTLPAVAAALLARDFIEAQFSAPGIAGAMLLLTGFIVWSTRYTIGLGDAKEPTWLGAFLIGCAQAFAILPGITRSGTTVAAGLALGLSPLAAAEFSFLLGIIAIAGAAVLLAPELTASSPELISAILVGGVAALISGLAALVSFIWLLRSQKFYIFSVYAWVVGGSFLAWVASSG